MHAGSWFDPTPPGSLALSLGRPPEETCLSLIHEMGHAMLSIKQQSEYSRHPRGEELIVNGAADVVCHRYAILDYAPRMQAIGLRACLAFAELSGTIQARAMRVAGQLLENMDRHSAVQATRTPIGLAEE